jgi:outer membrane protein TolC
MNRAIVAVVVISFLANAADVSAQNQANTPAPPPLTPSPTGITLPPPEPSLNGQSDEQDARIRSVLPQYQPSFEPTSVSDVVSLNPIRLQISVVDKIPVITQDLSLEEAVALSLRYSPAILAAAEAVAGARWLSRAAWSRLGPSASVNSFFSQSSIDQMLFFIREQVDPPPMQPVTKGTSFHAIFAAYQPLFTGGRLINSIRAARARQQQTQASSSLQRTSTVLDVKIAYWDTVLAQENLRVTHDYVKFRQWSVNNMRERVNVGKAPRADLLREEAELARARADVNERYGDYNKALVRLKTAVGVSVTSLISLKDTLDKTMTVKTLDEYTALARTQNPAVQQANARLREAQANRRVVAARFSPQAGLYGLASNATGKTPGEMETVRGKWGGTIGIMAGMTLFSSGERIFELNNASAAVRQADYEKSQAVLRAVQDVMQAWIDYETATRNVLLSRSELESAAEDQRLMHARYLVGKAIALEDFEAAVRLFRARLALLERMYRQNVAIAKLQSASGTI